MLPAAARLTSGESFRRCTREGRRAGSRTLVLHLCTSADAEATGPGTGPLVGFVVGRSVGGAVVRNRVRRRLRHLVRDRLAELPASSTLVVRALATAGEASYDELSGDLARCLERVTRPASRVGAPVTS